MRLKLVRTYFITRITTLITSLVMLFMGTQSFAGELRLFNDSGEPVKDYEAVLSKAKPNDVLVFPDGKKFPIDKIFPKTTNYFVASIGNGKTIKLPMDTESNQLTFKLLKGFYEAYPQLSSDQIPVPKLFLKESNPSYYLVLEDIKVEFTLESLLYRLVDVDAQTRKVALEKLVTFAAKTWKYKFIGNFRSRQLGWVNGDWVLLDFDHQGRLIKNADELDHVLKYVPLLPREIEEEASLAVRKTRKSIFERYKDPMGHSFSCDDQLTRFLDQIIYKK